MMNLKDGFVTVVKEGCPTCQLIVPVLAQLAESGLALTIYAQDTLTFLEPVPDGKDGNETQIVLDETLETSFRLNIETVSTLIQVEDEVELSRITGWQRAA